MLMNILSVGGGTLGSVTPLLAVVEELQKRYKHLNLEWWGTSDGPERQLIEAQGIAFKPIAAGKLRRYLSLDNVKDMIKIATGFVQALWRFGSAKPDCLLAAGSFVAVPVAWAAAIYRIPVLIHQQDVRPSLANKLMAPVAKRITVSLEVSLADFPKDLVVYTGNPIRAGFLKPPSVEQARASFGLLPHKPTIVFIGGGTGAEIINKLALEIVPELVKLYQVIHVTGADKGSILNLPNYKCLTLTIDSCSLLAVADIVVSRAGMGSLTELSALSKAAIIIPIPQSHQEDNAEYFVAKKSIISLPQSGLTGEQLLATVKRLLANDDERTELGKRLHDVIPAGATIKVADEVKRLIN
jgi:UDP-N-acetylglucosamine--N-acetylmuramyl-(pentapeptide) pyrophosphoryl-undecaprenol N-acetylglucosamine transferase